LVAVDDDRPGGDVESVLGFAELVTHPHVARHRHAADLELLVVRESAQGLGIGRRLLDSVVDLADNWLQIVRLSLTVWTDNLRAISLYESFGFEIEGTMPAYVWRKGTFVDAHPMGRVIGDAR
jgi:putative acetyltransferase